MDKNQVFTTATQLRHFVAVLSQSVAVLSQLLKHTIFLIYRDLYLFVAVVAVFLENSENQFFKKMVGFE